MSFSISKKVFASFLSGFVFLSLVNISCTKKTELKENGVVFDTIQVNKIQSVDYKNSKLNCNLNITLTYPLKCKEASQLSNLQKIFLDKAKVFSPQYINLPPRDAVNSFAEQYIKDFESTDFGDFLDEDSILEDENNYIYELSLENKILYNQNNFISFVVKSTDYEGGAHGSNSIYGCVIDLNTGRVLTEDDFAKVNYKKNLSPVIAQKIAASKGISDVSQLENNGYFAIENIAPNGNFTVDDKGITYYFNEYEIAAYFIGTTEVFIPYEELKAYITNDNPISSIIGK